MLRQKVPVVLLGGWLFADLLLGLTIIFLAALPGKPPVAPICSSIPRKSQKRPAIV